MSLAIGDVDTMIRLARAGLGVAILRSGNLDRDAGAGLVARSLDHFLPRSPIYAGVMRNTPLSPPLKHLMKLLKQTVKDNAEP